MSSPNNRRIALLASTIGWTVLGLSAASINWNSAASEGRSVPFAQLALTTLPYWLFYIPLTPLIIALGERFPLDQTRWKSSGAVHLAASVVVAVVHEVLYAVLIWKWYPFPANEIPPNYLVLLRGFASSRWHFELLVYWAILGTSLAIRYHRAIRDRDVAAAALEAQLGSARLRALRMQLQPHFLFNTLQTISVLVGEDPRKAQRMLTLLGDLLRRILGEDDRAEIPLREELAFLDRYLAIEETRFSDRLKIERCIDPETLDAMVPSFILQPIVENSIRYAVAPRAEPSVIEIEARRLDGRLRVEVRDHGPGPPTPFEPGVGLSATRARLETLYGSDHRFSLDGAEGGGAIAIVDLPFRTGSHGGS